MSSNQSRTRRSRSMYGIPVDGADKDRRRGEPRAPKWERIVKEFGGKFLVHLIRGIGAGINRILGSDLFLMLPFGILLMVTSTDFLVLLSVDDTGETLFFSELGTGGVEEGREDAEEVKVGVLRYVYVFVLLLTIVHWREIYGYFKRMPHLFVLFGWILLTATYSVEPVKVVTNTIIVLVGFLAATLFAKAHATDRRYSAFYAAVLSPMLVLHTSSFALLLFHEVNLIEFLFSSQRFGGLAGNPNSLGSTAVLGYWAAACLFLSRAVTKIIKLLCIVSIVLFLFHVIVSGSGTALVTIAIVTLLVFWLRIISAFRTRIRRVLNISAMIVAILLLVIIGIFSSPVDLYLAITEQLGKDATMTGRTVIWSIAREAIAVHPIVGWGFDSHISVMHSGVYEVDFNHYHNGFMDTIIGGGIILLLIVLYNLGRFCRAFFLTFRSSPAVFPMIMPLIMLLFLNLSEYSLLRPNSQIWGIYVVAFVMLTYPLPNNLKKRSATGSRDRSARSHSRTHKRRLRWA